MSARSLIALALSLLPAPAAAVGLGPLSKEGLTDGSKKAFWLDLVNPYEQSAAFQAIAIGYADETPASRVTIIPAFVQLGARHDRKLLVIANDLQPSETYQFRVCAQRALPPAGVTINARVCSKLTARRVP